MIETLVPRAKWIGRVMTIHIPRLIKARKALKGFTKQNNTMYILCPYGIGDTLFIASLMKSYKLHYNISRVCLIVKKNQNDLPGFFDAVDEIIVSSELVSSLTLYSQKLRVFKYKNYQYGHFILDFAWPEPGQLLCLNKISLIDIYKICVLKLPINAPLQLPHVFVSQLEMTKFQEKFGQGKKMLLMPYAVTVARLPIELWECLAREFQKQAYIVYTNIKDDSELPIKGTEAIDLSLKDLFVISKTFQWECIALRSGICDLLGFSNVKLTVIHENEEMEKAWNMCNLRLPNKNMKDIVINAAATLEENVQLIIEHY